jgi:hypothetical protein
MPTKITKPVFSLWKEMKENYVINKDWKPTKYTTIDKTPEAKKVIKTLNKKK